VRDRKRHILVGTLLLLKAKVLTGDVRDCNAARRLFAEIKQKMPRGSFGRTAGITANWFLWVAARCLWILEIVKRNKQLKKFVSYRNAGSSSELFRG
jgi:hypothetical protein